MKKRIVIIICLLALLLPLTACGGDDIVFHSHPAQQYGMLNESVFDVAVIKSAEALRAHVFHTKINGIIPPNNIFGYDESFFAENYLAITVIRSSGSVRFKADSARLDGGTYTVHIMDTGIPYDSTTDIVYVILITEIPNTIIADEVIYSLVL